MISFWERYLDHAFCWLLRASEPCWCHRQRGAALNPANPPQLKVFLSHTNEFSEYPRDISYVAKAKQAVEKSGYKVVEMADFSAQSTPPEFYDAWRVKECDVYIGILGMRYGTFTSQ